MEGARRSLGCCGLCKGFDFVLIGFFWKMLSQSDSETS